MLQWYPGHMAKAKRILEKDLKLVDLVIEVLDARIPNSSSNPDLEKIIHKQECIVVLNKIDLADPKITLQWQEYYQKKYETIRVNALKGIGINKLLTLVGKKGKEINENIIQKGRNKRDIRIIVIGIPNTGKSALINKLVGTSISKTGNKPGVTRGRQWVKVTKGIQLLDTPGILWPKFEENIAYKLAITGAISDDVFEQEMAAYKLIEYILEVNKEILEKVYDIKITSDISYDILPLIGKKRGCLMSGGKVDRIRASKTLLTDFRKGTLGAISLEKVED